MALSAIIFLLVVFAFPNWFGGWFDLGPSSLVALGFPNLGDVRLENTTAGEIEAIVDAAFWLYVIKSLVKLAWLPTFSTAGIFGCVCCGRTNRFWNAIDIGPI